MTSQQLQTPMTTRNPQTTGNPPLYAETAVGYRDIPLRKALGEYVTITSPILMDQPVPILERPSADGTMLLPLVLTPLTGQPYDDEAAQQTLLREELYLTAHLSELLEKYEGRFVAVLDNRVVDSDPNLDRLMERVYGRFGYRPVLMQRVERVQRRPARVPMPRKAPTSRDAI